MLGGLQHGLSLPTWQHQMCPLSVLDVCKMSPSVWALFCPSRLCHSYGNYHKQVIDTLASSFVVSVILIFLLLSMYVGDD